MSRIGLAVAALLVGLGCVGLGTARLIAQARRGLLDQLDAAQRQKADEMSRILQDDIDHVGADLRFIGNLVQTAPTANDRRDEISALVTSVREYQLVTVFDATGQRIM